jgi:nucleoside 2-deoxyribosyltransferase
MEQGRKMLIYFAGPLFSEAEKRFNLRLSERLEEAGFRVFLPQRDGVDGTKPPYDRMIREERRRAMFELDKQKVFGSDVFLFVLDGRVPDEGACVELGLAHAHRVLTGSDKLIVGLHTDERSAFVGSKLNPMVGVPLDHVVEDEESLLRALEGYRASGRDPAGSLRWSSRRRPNDGHDG